MKRRLIIAAIAAIAVIVIAGVFLKYKSFAAVNKPKRLLEKPVPQTPDQFDVLFKSACDLEEQGELVRAREGFRGLLLAFASHAGIEDAQKRLENLNMKIILSAVAVPGETAVREVKAGDVLSMIADEYHTAVDFIKKQNGLSSDVIRPGMRLRVWTGRFSVLVDKSQNLFTLRSGPDIVKTYRVSTGKGNITPVGTFKIINKLVNPSWTHGGKVIAFGDPQNILGSRWLGFDIPGYGIHGTTQPELIGQQVTAGCVRMLNEEVEEIYALLPLGTEVTITD